MLDFLCSYASVLKPSRSLFFLKEPESESETIPEKFNNFELVISNDFVESGKLASDGLF